MNQEHGSADHLPRFSVRSTCLMVAERCMQNTIVRDRSVRCKILAGRSAVDRRREHREGDALRCSLPYDSGACSEEGSEAKVFRF